jgi:hypothetical protein
MILGAILRLLLRRPVLIAAATLLLVSLLLVAARHTSLYAQEPVVRIYLRLVSVFFTTFVLLAFGGFLGKAAGELEGVRLCKVVPGIRRRINTGILILAPATGLLSTAFIHLALPDQFGLYELPPVFLANLFMFCLGLGLGWSWLQFPVLVVFMAKQRWLFRQLENNPALFTALILTVCVALLHLRHRRFLVASGSSGTGIIPWFISSFSIGVKPRRTGEPLRDRPGWDDPTPSVALAKLIRAGALERWGQSAFGLMARTWFSVLTLYLIFGGLSFSAWVSQKEFSFAEFYAHVFLSAQPTPVAGVMRVLFSLITGGLAFVSSLMLDTTLRPQLWHPLSRGLRTRGMFFSQLQQNALFMSVHMLATFAVLAGFAGFVGGDSLSLNRQSLSAFLLPALYAFVLMPIPQAVFPDGGETFRTKSEPKSQLLAGVVGGSFCLLIAYWTAYWPLKAIRGDLSSGASAALLGLLGTAVYFGYYRLLSLRFVSSDLRSRAV